MPTPMRPCPACAGAPEPGYHSGAGFRGVMCVQVACPLWRVVLPVALWNTLAEAMQLHQDWTTVAAVLREDTERLGEPTTLELGFEHGAWVADTTWWHHDGPIPEQEGRGETSGGALAVLAQHYRERTQKSEAHDGA